jgi:hypothetical protein
MDHPGMEHCQIAVRLTPPAWEWLLAALEAGSSR